MAGRPSFEELRTSTVGDDARRDFGGVVVTVDRGPTGVRVSASTDEGVVAATVHASPAMTDVRITLESGRVSPQVKRQLVESLFELDALREECDVEATVPLGEVEILDALRAHATIFATRAAGSTCLVMAHVEPDPAAEAGGPPR